MAEDKVKSQSRVLSPHPESQGILPSYILKGSFITKFWSSSVLILPPCLFWIGKNICNSFNCNFLKILKIAAMKRHAGALLSERSQCEEAACYVIPTTWCSEKGKTMQTVKRWTVAKSQGVQRDEEARAQRNFRALKKYPFVQTHRMCNTKSEPKCKCGLWVIVIC